jgi:hypothetical protein
MIVFEGCVSQDQEDLGSLQISEDEEHDEFVFVFVQCHFG